MQIPKLLVTARARGFPKSAKAQDADIGRNLNMQYSETCHGEDATRDGPLTELMMEKH